jgi:hypothetical protein
MASIDRSPWAVLGVAAGASTADIRRAYAKRLKEIRPDEDAAGFQRLVEARDLALQLASGERAVPRRAAEIRLADILETSRDGAAQLDLALPRDAREPPRPPAADASAEISVPPAQPAQDVLTALHSVLSTDDLAGWQAVARSMSALTRHQRATLESRLIESLGWFAAQESRNFAAWPPNKWPFFDLVAALDDEFGWRENDRVLYEVLDVQSPLPMWLTRQTARSLPEHRAVRERVPTAQEFTALLRWARHLASASTDATATDAHSHGLAPIALPDIHHFYDGGRDQRGLDAYWIMVNDPSLWRPYDAATYLFFPVWSWQDGRYGMALLGLVGWAALIMAFAPWQLEAVLAALPWLAALPKGRMDAFVFMLPATVAFWYIAGSSPPPSPQRKSTLIGPLWDSLAFFVFPVWAIARRLYVRAAIGFIAWLAIAHQLYAYGEPSLLLAGTVMLVVMFHLTAGEYGQRWVVYKLQRSIAAANKSRIFDPEQRADYLRRRGTRNPALWTNPSRREARLRTALRPRTHLQSWWKWMLLVGAIMGLIRLVDVFLRSP